MRRFTSFPIILLTLVNLLDYKFDLMYSKRAFVHWYVGEGMEEVCFLDDVTLVLRADPL